MYWNYFSNKEEKECAELKNGKWYIKSGFAGCNCNKNNLYGYDSKAEAEATCRRYESK